MSSPLSMIVMVLTMIMKINFFFVTKRRFILTNMNCKQETEDRLVKKKTHPYLHQTRLKSQHTLRLALYIKTNNKLLPQITE